MNKELIIVVLALIMGLTGITLISIVNYTPIHQHFCHHEFGKNDLIHFDMRQWVLTCPKCGKHFYNDPDNSFPPHKGWK